MEQLDVVLMVLVAIKNSKKQLLKLKTSIKCRGFFVIFDIQSFHSFYKSGKPPPNNSKGGFLYIYNMKLKIMALIVIGLGFKTMSLAATIAEKSEIDIVVIDDINSVDVELQSISIAEDFIFMKITNNGDLPLGHAESMGQVKSVSKAYETLKGKDTKSLQHRARDDIATI